MSCGESITGELNLLLTLLQDKKKSSIGYITSRLSCGVAWRDPGFIRVSAGAADNECQGRDRSRRLLQPAVRLSVYSSHSRSWSV